ncbi:MAG: hypothetical protein Q9172_006787 [Xanthocarpia lactea]
MNTTLLSQETDLNWLSGKEVYDVNSSIDTVTATHKGEKFWMSGLNKESLYNYLSVQTFTGTASMRAETRDGGGNSSENDVVRRIQASLYKDGAGIDGLSRLLNNLAVSMSNALRTTTDLPDNVTGISSSFEVYIQIEWTWMIVPIATIILSLIFLLITIHLSWQRRIPAWKSSLLAVLLGLNSETRSELGGIGQLKEMEEMAEKKGVRLQGSGGRWQIVKAD